MQKEGRDYLKIKEFLKVSDLCVYKQLQEFMLLILKARFISKNEYHIETLLNLAYKETKDEFEDPEDVNR